MVVGQACNVGQEDVALAAPGYEILTESPHFFECVFFLLQNGTRKCHPQDGDKDPVG